MSRFLLITGASAQVNVRYHTAGGNYMSQMQEEVAFQKGIHNLQDALGADKFLEQKLGASSFLKDFPLDASVSDSPGAMSGGDEWTINMVPPQEGAANLAALAKAEDMASSTLEAESARAKSRLLNAEIKRVHEIVQKHSSFLAQKNEQVNLHAPSESASDIASEYAAILANEDANASSAASDDAAAKQQLLQAELAEIGKIMGTSSFLSGPFQAELPNEIRINYDAPRSSFLRDAVPRSLPTVNVDIDTAAFGGKGLYESSEARASSLAEASAELHKLQKAVSM